MTTGEDGRSESASPGSVERRAEVLRHVVALIGRHGIDGMTMRQVASEAGLSTGTINYHFGNKRGLILAALESVGGAPFDESRSPSNALDGLRRLFSGFILDGAERLAWWRFWVECTAQAARDPELSEFQRARHEHQREEVERWIALGVRRGELRADLDPGALAEPLLALAYGLAVAQLTFPDASTARRASDAIEGSLRELAAR